jgi:hypothetical protein
MDERDSRIGLIPRHGCILVSLLSNYRYAKLDALIADEDRGSRDEMVYLVLPFPTE